MEDNNVNLFEVPADESQVVPEAESTEEVQQSNNQMPDLRGLGLLDYEQQLADQAEASSPDQVGQDVNSEQQGQYQETPEAKEDPGRLQYWQSKADKAEAAYQKMAKLAPDAIKYAPLIEAIQTDQEVLNMIQNKVNGGTLGQRTNGQPQQNGSPAPVPQQATPQGPPVKPKRPEQYDPAAAIHETDTASFQYREALEQYRDDMDEWRNNQEAIRYNQMMQSQQQQQQQKYITDNYNLLKHEYGATDDQINTYNSWLQDPSTLSVQNLWRYHQYLNQPETQKKITKQKVQDSMQQAQKAATIPNTPTKSGGKPNPTLSDADLFNLDLMAINKKR